MLKQKFTQTHSNNLILL